MASCIKIEGMRFKAYHGCIAEEALSGGDFEVHVYAWFDMKKSAINDDLNYTLNYTNVYNIAKKEMGIPSKLIEHVAQRIYSEILNIPTLKIHINQLEVHVCKINPPVNGYIAKATAVFDGT